MNDSSSGSSIAFWFSHHRDDELHRTYSIAGVHLCARCLGTYPVLFALVGWQIARHAPIDWSLDAWWTLVLPVPAILDWAYGRFRPRSGSNALRTATGVLLGLALGRSLYIHLKRPYPLWLVLQAVEVLVVAVPVSWWTYRQKQRQ